MDKTLHSDRPDARPNGIHMLNPLRALLVFPDKKQAREVQELVEDVACDWRLNHTTDGAEAARHVMKNGLPQLVIAAAELPKVGCADFVEWLRSFGGPGPVAIFIHGTPPSDADREELLRHEAELLPMADASRAMAARRLAQTIDRIEKRHLASYANR